jgi:hypothetical protein
MPMCDHDIDYQRKVYRDDPGIAINLSERLRVGQHD